MTSVEMNTISTAAAKTPSSISPCCRPTDATIRPTSPREIMPTPTRAASAECIPASLAPSPAPATLETMATSTSATMNKTAVLSSPRAFTRRPMLTRKRGTKNA